MAFALIGLGANLNDRAETLRGAIERLREQPRLAVQSVSTWKETLPVGGPAGQPSFLNGAALLETSHDPRTLLGVLQDVEREFGRQREAPWAARTLDLDLLLYDELTIDEGDLIVPHPRMAFRRFVLEPAAEAAPELRHPQIRWTVQELLQHLNEAPNYLAIAGMPGAGKGELARRAAGHAGAACCADPDLDTLNEFADDEEPALVVELAIARTRAAAVEDHLANSRGGVVSDFWLEQSRAYAATLGTVAQQSSFQAEFESALRNVPPPRLVVLLTGVHESETPHKVRRRPLHDDDARLRAELHTLATRPGRGPFLVLDAANFNRAVEETSAALVAMR